MQAKAPRPSGITSRGPRSFRSFRRLREGCARGSATRGSSRFRWASWAGSAINSSRSHRPSASRAATAASSFSRRGRTADFLNFRFRKFASVRQFQRRYSRTFAYEEIAIDRATELFGYFQSYRYFEHCEDEVRRFFTPHHTLSHMLEAGFSDLLAAKTCSVHVRRTDYVGGEMWTELGATTTTSARWRSSIRTPPS